MAKLGPCHFCGSTENIELHHIDPDTKVSHKIWSWRKERLEAELEKCIGICKECHDKFHGLLKRKAIEHGTLHAYDQHKCRCDACRAAAAERRYGYYLAERKRIKGEA